MTVIPAVILVGAASYIYNQYYSPTPAKYEFLRGEGEICTVEYAIVTIGSDGSVSTSRVGFVSDLEGFVNDIKETDFYEGIAIESIKALRDIKTLSGFVINYNDGSFEVITPHFSITSELSLTDIGDLLEVDIYSFDKARIEAMLIKYAPPPELNQA